MQIYESVGEMLEKTNAKKLAALVNLSKSQIYRYAENPETSGTRMPADIIPMFTRLSGNPIIIQNLCQLCGGVYIPIKEEKNVDFKKLLQKKINSTKVIIDSNLDGKITKQELKKIKKAIYDCIMASAAYVSFLEEEK